MAFLQFLRVIEKNDKNLFVGMPQTVEKYAMSDRGVLSMIMPANRITSAEWCNYVFTIFISLNKSGGSLYFFIKWDKKFNVDFNQ